MQFDFELVYRLSVDDGDVDTIVKRIYDTGCDFGLGTGKPGHLGLLCTVEAAALEEAIRMATQALQPCMPGAVRIR